MRIVICATLLLFIALICTASPARASQSCELGQVVLSFDRGISLRAPVSTQASKLVVRYTARIDQGLVRAQSARATGPVRGTLADRFRIRNTWRGKTIVLHISVRDNNGCHKSRLIIATVPQTTR